MFRIMLTPMHPEGHPKVGKSYKCKDPHAPFFMRYAVGSKYVRCATREEAETFAANYRALRDSVPRTGNMPNRYDLATRVVEN